MPSVSQTSWIILGLSLASPCLFAEPNQEGFTWELQPDASLHLYQQTQGASPRLIWQSSAGGQWIEAADVEVKSESNQGSFTIELRERSRCRIDAQQAEWLSPKQLRLPLRGNTACEQGFVSLELEAIDNSRVRLTIAVEGWQAQWLQLKLRSEAKEAFFGFGLQPSILNLKGHRVPILSQEQGITRGRQPWSALVNSQEKGAAGTAYTSYMAAPQFISSKQRGLYLENKQYSVFDMTAEKDTKIELLHPKMQLVLMAGENPKALLQSYTEYAGRMSALPDWFHQGAVIGMQGGTQRVREVWGKLQKRGTPLAGFWLQDWVGKRTTSLGSQLWWNWELDEQYYQNWAELQEDMQQAGLGALAYINPHLVNVSAAGKTQYRRNLYDEAEKQGFFIQNNQGQTYPVRLTAFDTGMLDLSNTKARTWYKDLIKKEIIGRGFKGWMCDYGESYPLDAVNAARTTGVAAHHQYLEEWAKLQTETAAELGLSREIVSFCRAAYTQSPGLASLFWQGDQMVTWDDKDGFATAVTGLLSGGFSGFSLNHSDLGGYTTLSRFGIGLKRERELLQRWMEMSAFTSAFRSHEGNLPEENIQIYSDESMLDAFDRQARIFASLFSYRKQLMQEAQQKGWPLVRAMALEIPSDPKALLIQDQFFLGSEILVAPILTKNAKQRNVYLPEGEWQHLWSGQVIAVPQGGKTMNFTAPLGQTPVFTRAGSAFANEWKKQLANLGIAL